MAGEAEIESAEAALADAGIEIEMRIDNDRKRSLFIDDPDGMRCEFYAARDAGLHNMGADLIAVPRLTRSAAARSWRDRCRA